MKVTFAGAKRPLYFFKTQTQELTQLKGTRRSIGGYQNEDISFSNQEIILEKGDAIYLSTDGFIDQNNIKRRSFGDAKFKEIALKRGHLSMDHQKKLLVDTLKNHMKGTEQRDDILVLGIKL